ncbi:Rho-related GTP-binding protein RhoJ [Aphelenchoides besseyi]|nr:Rho-related GTP-binding protein RhoJ [Aphelenchoides besseyi]
MANHSVEPTTLPAEPITKRLKIVLIGDSNVGKSSLIYTFVNNQPHDVNARPLTVLDPQEKLVHSEGKNYVLWLHDTEVDQELRIKHYSDVDAVIICYSVSKPASLRNVSRKWVPELKECLPGKPFLLAGLQVDIRQTPNPAIYLTDEFEGMRMATLVDAQAFFECSAKTMLNVARLFEEVPVIVERELLRIAHDAATQIRVPPTAILPSVYQFLSKPVHMVTACSPFLRQAYHNLCYCASNPSAFVEKKKSVVNYVPWLKGMLPFEDTTISKEEEVLKTAKEKSDEHPVHVVEPKMKVPDENNNPRPSDQSKPEDSS